MIEYDNLTLMKRVMSTLHLVSGRRTSPGFSITVINTILKNIQREFEFLRYIETKDTPYTETGQTATISYKINRVDPYKIGTAVEKLIRIICMDLKEDAGLYFINEFKENLGDEYTLDLISRGVNFDLLESDIKKLYLLRKRSKTVHIPDATVEQKKKKLTVPQKSLLGYTWENVSTWKYENNICILYDSEGKELDRLSLDVIVKDYVRRLSEFDKLLQDHDQPLDITEKEDEFLRLLYTRDMDIEFAIALLHISREELDAMVKRLLYIEILHYSAYDEIKLTEKGVNYLLAKKVLDKPEPIV